MITFLKIIIIVLLIVVIIWVVAKKDWGPFGILCALIISLLTLALKERQGQANPDKKLFDLFIKTLPSDGSISFIKEHDFGGSFRHHYLDELRKFAQEWDDSEHEFLSKGLEKQRKEIYLLVGQFLKLIAKNTFVSHNEIQGVPSEWRIDKPEQWKNIVEELHSLADKIFESHQSLVRMARKKLRH